MSRCRVLSWTIKITLLLFVSPLKHWTPITDVSPVGIGTVLEQHGYSVVRVSRRLIAAEQGYSEAQREALAIYWPAQRIHKYLFGSKFTIISDHETLRLT